MLADGTLSRGGLSVLFRHGIYERLGLDSVEMQVLLEDLARDLYEFGMPTWDDAGGLHPIIVRCVLDDVTDPQLRTGILEICQTVAESDSHISDGEGAVLDMAVAQWRIPQPMTGGLS